MTTYKKSDLQHIAKLAKLELSPKEIEQRLSEFNDIVGHIANLEAVPTDDVLPLLSISFDTADSGTPMQKDERLPGLDRDDALHNAPDRQDHFFRVPRMLSSGKK